MKKQENIAENQLKAMAGNQSPFSVPDNYFENLPGIMSAKIQALPDFDKTAVINPFSVPDGYFEKLPEMVSSKITSRKKSIFISLWRPRFTIPVAIAMLLIAAGLFYFSKMQPTENNQQRLTADELNNSTYLFSIDEDVIIDVLANQKVVSKNDDVFEQYLIDNNIEISQLEQAL